MDYPILDPFLGYESSTRAVGVLGLDDGGIAVFLGFREFFPCLQKPLTDLTRRCRVHEIAYQVFLLNAGGQIFGNNFAALLFAVINQTRVTTFREGLLAEAPVYLPSPFVQGRSPSQSPGAEFPPKLGRQIYIEPKVGKPEPAFYINKLCQKWVRVSTSAPPPHIVEENDIRKAMRHFTQRSQNRAHRAPAPSCHRLSPPHRPWQFRRLSWFRPPAFPFARPLK
jgi:hypothetical protein